MSAGPAKRGASKAAIAAGEGVPVKQVHKIRFNGQHVRLVQREAFDQREVLIYITMAPYVPKRLRKVAEGVASLGYKVWSVWIEKRRAVKKVVC